MTSEKHVFDAYAWIEYLIGSDVGKKVKAILDNAEAEVYTCAVTVAEIISKTVREGRNFEDAYDVIVSDSNVIDADEKLSKETGLLHAEMRRKIKDFGLADAYVLASARKIGGKVLTGDPHFKNVRDAILIN